MAKISWHEGMLSMDWRTHMNTRKTVNGSVAFLTLFLIEKLNTCLLDRMFYQSNKIFCLSWIKEEFPYKETDRTPVITGDEEQRPLRHVGERGRSADGGRGLKADHLWTRAGDRTPRDPWSVFIRPEDCNLQRLTLPLFIGKDLSRTPVLGGFCDSQAFSRNEGLLLTLKMLESYWGLHVQVLINPGLLSRIVQNMEQSHQIQFQTGLVDIEWYE